MYCVTAKPLTEEINLQRRFFGSYWSGDPDPERDRDLEGVEECRLFRDLESDLLPDLHKVIKVKKLRKRTAMHSEFKTTNYIFST